MTGVAQETKGGAYEGTHERSARSPSFRFGTVLILTGIGFGAVGATVLVLTLGSQFLQPAFVLFVVAQLIVFEIPVGICVGLLGTLGGSLAFRTVPGNASLTLKSTATGAGAFLGVTVGARLEGLLFPLPGNPWLTALAIGLAAFLVFGVVTVRYQRSRG